MKLPRTGWRIWIPLVLLSTATGCVTIAEHRKLEREVIDMQRARGVGPDPSRVADLAAQMSALEQSIGRLEGRLEVAEHKVEEALREARAARADAAAASVRGAAAAGDPGSQDAAEADAGVSPEELQAYHGAYGLWRSGDAGACVDRFRNFLQTYPSSAYADDAAYWMADCYFKQGDFKTAILRFDDVVSRYPAGNKAADALYRQGEALVRLGHGKAAVNAFERILEEYPDSARAPEAKRQLEVL